MLKSFPVYADISDMEDVKIENWEVVYTPKNPYQAPECCHSQLYGQVYGHPNFEEGKFITTSTIMDTNSNRVKTYNRWYVLGEPSEKYAKWCSEKCPHIDLTKPFKEK